MTSLLSWLSQVVTSFEKLQSAPTEEAPEALIQLSQLLFSLLIWLTCTGDDFCRLGAWHFTYMPCPQDWARERHKCCFKETSTNYLFRSRKEAIDVDEDTAIQASLCEEAAHKLIMFYYDLNNGGASLEKHDSSTVFLHKCDLLPQYTEEGCCTRRLSRSEAAGTTLSFLLRQLSIQRLLHLHYPGIVKVMDVSEATPQTRRRLCVVLASVLPGGGPSSHIHIAASCLHMAKAAFTPAASIVAWKGMDKYLESGCQVVTCIAEKLDLFVIVYQNLAFCA
eukprot:SM000347S12994  [mRNA]  locus=s347:7779:13740:+ [translate_table: standard]